MSHIHAVMDQPLPLSNSATSLWGGPLGRFVNVVITLLNIEQVARQELPNKQTQSAWGSQTPLGRFI